MVVHLAGVHFSLYFEVGTEVQGGFIIAGEGHD